MNASGVAVVFRGAHTVISAGLPVVADLIELEYSCL